MVIGQKIGYDHDSLDFAHGQRSKLSNFDHMTMLTLNFRRWSWSKMIKFDHMTAAILKFWQCSLSNIFDHMTITPGYTCLVVKKRGRLTPSWMISISSWTHDWIHPSFGSRCSFYCQLLFLSILTDPFYAHFPIFGFRYNCFILERFALNKVNLFLEANLPWATHSRVFMSRQNHCNSMIAYLFRLHCRSADLQISKKKFL